MIFVTYILKISLVVLFLILRKMILHTELYKQTTNSVALARKRTIPTERPPHVGEVSAFFCE
jgi:hypothetical protein